MDKPPDWYSKPAEQWPQDLVRIVDGANHFGALLECGWPWLAWLGLDDPVFRAKIEDERIDRQGDKTIVTYRHGRMNVTITVSPPSPQACTAFAQEMNDILHRAMWVERTGRR